MNEKTLETPLQVPNTYQNLISQAEKKRTLFKKHAKIIGERKSLSKFKEPCAILMRRSGAGEWYENVTKGKFNFTHSDGQPRFILITGKPQDMNYGKDTFKLYILHEDFPLPLPEDPIYTTEQIGQMLENALLSSAKLKARDWAGKNQMIKTIVIGLAVVIGGFILYNLLIPSTPDVIVQTAPQAAQAILP